MSAPDRSWEKAALFVGTAIRNIGTPWPQRVDGIQSGPQALPEPALLHPAFRGSYDWHSCVHMQWLIMRLLRQYPGQPWQQQACALLDQRLTTAHIAREIDFLASPGNAVFERPYGWAWVLKLTAEAERLQGSLPQAVSWRLALDGLAQALGPRLQAYFEHLAFPVRAGAHANTAFAMLLALDYAESCTAEGLRQSIHQQAQAWFGNDVAYPAHYEPDGEDFLSGGLTEAALMSRLMHPEEFRTWWQRFCPAGPGWQSWQTPVPVAQRGDLKMVHLDGLNLSRAWCLRILAKSLPEMHSRCLDAAERHEAAALPYVTGEGYAGEHWLASFATLALVT